MDLTNIESMSCRPENWQDFEKLCCDLWRAIWKDPNAQRNGREGQAQHGVDICTSSSFKGGVIGIQCKGKGSYIKASSLSVSEINEEVKKALTHEPKLTEFIIAYTGPSDNELTKHAARLTDDHKKEGLFSVDIISWPSIWSLLAQRKEILKTHYSFLFQNTGLSEQLHSVEKKFNSLSEQMDLLVTLISNQLNSIQSEDSLNNEGVQIVSSRFLSVFEEHGLNKPTTAELLKPYGISLGELYNPSLIVAKITNEVLDFVNGNFDVNKDWLLNDDDTVLCNLSYHRWYKSPYRFLKRLLELEHLGKRYRVIFLRGSDSDFERAYRKGDNVDAERIGILIEIENNSLSGTSFYTYETWDFERWNYYKTRRYYKILVLFLDKVNRYKMSNRFIGRELNQQDLYELALGKVLPVSVLKKNSFGSVWYPEDYVNDSYSQTREKDELHEIENLFKREKLYELLEQFNNL